MASARTEERQSRLRSCASGSSVCYVELGQDSGFIHGSFLSLQPALPVRALA